VELGSAGGASSAAPAFFDPSEKSCGGPGASPAVLSAGARGVYGTALGASADASEASDVAGDSAGVSRSLSYQ
jgi:hypothetical protein